jgi:peroxiredoxin
MVASLARTIHMTAELNPRALEARLMGLVAPAIELPWNTYEDQRGQELLGPHAITSLAQLARRRTLVVYFYPVEPGDDCEGDTLPNVFRDRSDTFAAMYLTLVGISTQTPREQLEMAGNDLLPPYHLADSHLRLADHLRIPTREIDGKDHYEPLILIVYRGRIAKVFYPIISPRACISSVLAWLARYPTPKPHDDS